MPEIENKNKENKWVLDKVLSHVISFAVYRTIFGQPYFIYIIALLVILALLFR